MVIHKRIKKLVSRFKKKRPTVKKVILPPKKVEPIRAVDIGTKEKLRVAGITIKGEPVKKVGRRPITPTEIKKAISPKKPTITKPKVFLGPVRPTTKEEVFRKKGIVRRKLKLKPTALPTIIPKRKKFDILKERKRTGFYTLEVPKEKKKLTKEELKKMTTKEKAWKGLELLSGKQKERRTKLLTELERDRKFKLKRELELFGGTLAGVGIEAALGIRNLPKAAVNVLNNPGKFLTSVKDLPSSLKRGAVNFGKVLRLTPTVAIAQIGGEVLLLKGTGKTLEVTGRFTEKVTTKLNPLFVGEATTGNKLIIKGAKGKKLSLEVSGKMPKESLRSQIEKAGKRVDAISSQADSLLTLLKRERVVRKPIPNEDKLNKFTKELLAKFDKGKINKKELLTLENLIKKQGAKGLLERSFFADPTGKIRPSRLGVLDEKAKKSVLDYFIEDITFRKPKPQILLFEDIKIQKFPKNLQEIANKLKAGKTLTQLETNRLLGYQLKISRKFKPLGFTSKESEITLAPGEILQKVKKVGVTLVNGRKVPIISTRVYKPTGKIKTLMNEFKKGKLTKKQVKELDNLLSKKTGFKYKSGSSYKKGTKKYVSIKRIGASALITRPIKRKLLKRPPKRVPRRPKRRPPVSPPKRVPRRKKSISPARPPKRPLKRVLRRKKSISPPGRRRRPGKPAKVVSTVPRVPKRKKVKKVRKKGLKHSADVYGKDRGRQIKLNRKPLSLTDAKNRGAYAIDHTTARTLKIVPRGKRRDLGKITTKEKGYFKKTKHKYREMKIRKKKGIKTPNRFIEKRKYGIDTLGEKKQLSLARLSRELKRPKTRKKRGRKK